MTTIHNERVKLRANALNSAACSCFSMGVLAPMAAAFYSTMADHIPIHIVIIGVAFWFGMAYTLHIRAQTVLEDLQDE
jgi:hypothetical protein